ncbi:MAG: hypothetical protein ACLFR1_10745 [Spirochaetia bacterium]
MKFQIMLSFFLLLVLALILSCGAAEEQPSEQEEEAVISAAEEQPEDAEQEGPEETEPVIEAAEEPEPEEDVMEVPDDAVEVTPDELAVTENAVLYSQPMFGAERVSRFQPTESFYLISKSNWQMNVDGRFYNWFEVMTADAQGWVFGHALGMTEDIAEDVEESETSLEEIAPAETSLTNASEGNPSTFGQLSVDITGWTEGFMPPDRAGFGAYYDAMNFLVLEVPERPQETVEVVVQPSQDAPEIYSRSFSVESNRIQMFDVGSGERQSVAVAVRFFDHANFPPGRWTVNINIDDQDLPVMHRFDYEPDRFTMSGRPIESPFDSASSVRGFPGDKIYMYFRPAGEENILAIYKQNNMLGPGTFEPFSVYQIERGSSGYWSGVLEIGLDMAGGFFKPAVGTADGLEIIPLGNISIEAIPE